MPRRRGEKIFIGRKEARYTGEIILPLKFELDILFYVRKDEPLGDLGDAIGRAWAKAFGEMLDHWTDRLFAEGRRGTIQWPPLQFSTLAIRKMRGIEHDDPMIETGQLFNTLKDAIKNIQIDDSQTKIRFPRKLQKGLEEGVAVAGIVYEGSASFRYPPVRSLRSGGKKRRRRRPYFYPIAHFFWTRAPVFGRGPLKYKPPRPFLPQSNEDLTQSDLDILANGIRTHVEQAAMEVAVAIAVRYFRKIRKVEVGEIQFPRTTV